jgi:hypothetical protein
MKLYACGRHVSHTISAAGSIAAQQTSGVRTPTSAGAGRLACSHQAGAEGQLESAGISYDETGLSLSACAAPQNVYYACLPYHTVFLGNPCCNKHTQVVTSWLPLLTL